jgi:ribosomal protein S14
MKLLLINEKNFHCIVINVYTFVAFTNLTFLNLELTPHSPSPVRQRNRCWVTGRSRGFYRDFGLSRHALREMGNEGLIPGLRKSSW